MRWLVEVSSLGKTDTQKFCVEAESWQRALHAARLQRGEDGPMSGFSIELLEEGYRAVDPLARVRFVVKKAPDDMPITPVPTKEAHRSGGVAPTAPSTPPSAPSPPAPSSGSAEPTTPNLPPSPSSSSVSGKKKTPPRPAQSQPPPAGVGSAQPPTPAVDVTGDVKKKSDTMVFASSGDASVIIDDQVEHHVEQIAPPSVGSAIPGLPPVKVLTAREQNPNDASPLTYREYAFAVADGTSEEVGAEVLRAQLRLVEAHIATVKTGKLVNLAVFDVEFTGKPPRAPLATLTWKDWKGEPILGFPRRGGGPSKPPRPPSRVPPSMAAAAEAAAVAAAVVIPQAATVPQSMQPAPPPAPPAKPPPPPAAAHAFTPVAPPEPTFTEAAPRKVPSHPAPADGGGMVKTPSGRFVRGRISGDELITSLFESMHDLHFLRDALDGGQFCLALATEVLPARAAIIHFFDIEKREWVVACTRGKEMGRLLTMRAPEADEILREAAKRRRALVMANAGSATSERYRQLNGARSLIAAPIMQAGRALGALEIINPLDGMPFTEDEGNAMTYIAEQYAEYLGSRGIVLDRERIQSAAAAR